MATSNYQKIKMLKLMEMLRRDADEANPMTTEEICRRLIAMEISCDRRTVTKDIELLNQYGYEVQSRMVGHKKGYFLSDHTFSDSELRILVDAVQAANFITEKKSEELIEKLAFLGSSHREERMRSSIVRFNSRKHTNEQVYYAVQNIETALLEKKKVSFFYYDLDENGERVYRKDKARYVVDPIALVMHEDLYYLLAYSTKYRNKTTYRIDRMDIVEVEDAEVCQKAIDMRADVDVQVKRAFKMFAGKTARVTLEFDHQLIGCIYDKFGEDTRITPSPVRPDRFRAAVSVDVSPTFFGWIFQFMGAMEIIAPRTLRKEYATRVVKLAHNEVEWMRLDKNEDKVAKPKRKKRKKTE